MKKISILLFALLTGFSVMFANDDNVHEMSNMKVSINAVDTKSSRFIETVSSGSKEYIVGKSSSYNKKGEASGGKLLGPYAEYAIEAGLSGGDYVITAYYKIDTKTAPSDARIILGMDLLETQELAVEKKLLSNSVKATFSTKLLKGKKHTLKVWLPSEGVQIDKFEVRRALIKKK